MLLREFNWTFIGQLKQIDEQLLVVAVFVLFVSYYLAFRNWMDVVAACKKFCVCYYNNNFQKQL